MGADKKAVAGAEPAAIAPEMAYACPHSDLQAILEESCIGTLLVDAGAALPVALNLGVGEASFTVGMAAIAWRTINRLAVEIQAVTLLEVVYAGEWAAVQAHFDEGPEETAMRYLEKCVSRCPSAFLAVREFRLLRLEEARRIVWNAAREALQGLDDKRDTWELAKGLADSLRALASIKRECEA